MWCVGVCHQLICWHSAHSFQVAVSCKCLHAYLVSAIGFAMCNAFATMAFKLCCCCFAPSQLLNSACKCSCYCASLIHITAYQPFVISLPVLVHQPVLIRVRKGEREQGKVALCTCLYFTTLHLRLIFCYLQGSHIYSLLIVTSLLCVLCRIRYQL